MRLKRDLRFQDALSNVERLDQAEVRTDAGWIRVRPAPLERTWGRQVHESWEIEASGPDLSLRRTQASSNGWLVVPGVPRARLIGVP